jgi:excisionase family DNA binding protein
MEEQRRFLNTKEVAALLGVSVRTVSQWASMYQESAGKEGLPGYRFGKRSWSFDRSEVERWIEGKRGVRQNVDQGA